jgi:translation initiation factor IF-3
MHGIVPINEALEMAKQAGLDLVEVAPNAKPPVCKILNFGKFKFEQQKKNRESKKKQKIVKVKEIRMHPKTEEHDYKFKVNHAREFIEHGCKVKFTLRFKGREFAHVEIGERLLNKAIEDLGDLITVERKPTLEGRSMVLIVAPNKKK